MKGLEAFCVKEVLRIILENLNEALVAIYYIKLAVDDYCAVRNRRKKYVYLALGILTHLRYAHFWLRQSVKQGNCHISACLIAATAAIHLVFFRLLAKLKKSFSYLFLRVALVDNRLRCRRIGVQNSVALLQKFLCKSLVAFEKVFVVNVT